MLKVAGDTSPWFLTFAVTRRCTRGRRKGTRPTRTSKFDLQRIFSLLAPFRALFLFPLCVLTHPLYPPTDLSDRVEPTICVGRHSSGHSSLYNSMDSVLFLVFPFLPLLISPGDFSFHLGRSVGVNGFGTSGQGKAFLMRSSYFLFTYSHIMTIEVPAGLRSWLISFSFLILSLDLGVTLCFSRYQWACDDAMLSSFWDPLFSFFSFSFTPLQQAICLF